MYDCMNDYHAKTACAIIKGGPLAPRIKGAVWFQDIHGGTLVTARIYGLPEYHPAAKGRDPVGPHGFHIHVKGSCEVGDPMNPFLAAGEHYNPDDQPHGNHAGDFPVLFSNNGFAYLKFFTEKFQVKDVIGRAVIIHMNPDDYRSQPAGNSGRRLACGVIRKKYYDC